MARYATLSIELTLIARKNSDGTLLETRLLDSGSTAGASTPKWHSGVCGRAQNGIFARPKPGTV